MRSPVNEQFVVLNDEPITDNHEDLLGRSSTADRLTELIVASRWSTPFTLAIDAGWGMGKSSLMRQLQWRIGEVDGMHTVWFNAWTSGADVLEVLIKSVVRRFDRNVVRRAYNRIMADKRVSGVSRIALAIATSLLGLPRLIDAIWSQLAVDAKRRNEIQDVVRAMAQEWASTPRADGKQIVVFVDDLDRCTNDVVLAVCEAIKLYLDVPGVIFVIGCDQNVLFRNINRTNSGAAQYLEKVVQVNYQAPLPGVEQVGELVRAYAARAGTVQMFDEELSTFVAERTGRNPRRIKRLINSFVLEYHLDNGWQEIGANMLVRILLLQHFYPEFYRLLASPTSTDPVGEFLEYRDFRTSVRRGELAPGGCKDLFKSYGLEPPDRELGRDRLADLLHEIEQEIPDQFPSLVTDEDFISTLRQLKDYPGYDRLRRHLQRRRVQLDPGISPSRENMNLPDENADFHGIRVLVVDDAFAFAGNYGDFHDSGGVRRTFREWGAEVETASDFESLERALRRTRPDVIVSDIRRHGDDNAGLDDLEVLRERGLYAGPAVFYVSRVTAARRKRAAELGAIGVTNSFAEALELARMAVSR